MKARHITTNGVVVPVLTDSEARGLLACAAEGAEGLLTYAAAAYIGSGSQIAAARRSFNALQAAVSDIAEKAAA